MSSDVFLTLPLPTLPSYEQAVNSSDVNDVVVLVKYFKEKYAIADGSTIVVNRINQLLGEIDNGSRKLTSDFFTKNIESLNASIKYCENKMKALELMSQLAISEQKCSVNEGESTAEETNYKITQQNIEKMKVIRASLIAKREWRRS